MERFYGQQTRDVIEALIQKHKGRVRTMADELGISTPTLLRWRRKPGITIDHAANPPPLSQLQRLVLAERFGIDGGRRHSLEDVAVTLGTSVGAEQSAQRTALRKVEQNPPIISPRELAILRRAKPHLLRG